MNPNAKPHLATPLAAPRTAQARASASTLPGPQSARRWARACATAALCLAGLNAANAAAGAYTLTVTGTINRLENIFTGGPAVLTNLAVGDTLTFVYDFDTSTAVDAEPRADTGTFEQSVFSFTAVAPTFTVRHQGPGVPGSIGQSVFSGSNDLSFFSTGSFAASGTVGGTPTLYSAQVSFFDGPDAGALTTAPNSLPPNADWHLAAADYTDAQFMIFGTRVVESAYLTLTDVRITPFVASPVPEPGTAPLALLSALALAARWRWKRPAAAA